MDMIEYPHGYVTDIDSGYGDPTGDQIGYYGYLFICTDVYGYVRIYLHIRTYPGVQYNLHGYVGQNLDMKGYPCGYLNGYPLG